MSLDPVVIPFCEDDTFGTKNVSNNNSKTIVFFISSISFRVISILRTATNGVFNEGLQACTLCVLTRNEKYEMSILKTTFSSIMFPVKNFANKAPTTSIIQGIGPQQ